MASITTIFLDLSVQFSNLSDTPQKSKGKWSAFANRISGLTTPEITEHIQKTSLKRLKRMI